ncbi:TIM barrel protein [Micromonospora endophytica]|uniref:Inosose dehydratase n=1 Tax=Micromonospora endophytica TaxID=515350 RepID=A0A2W2DV57_9ACTN|nr:TIM barrel protein [Micromonospora endophytica]PZG01057.1 inosose dehydratase [Micromonospora endophytica]RIW47901.1 inosose dehydratase [Micromonospora endophytica]BCJ62271.1 inosose dehydratase [Micromonospora endophytica]
MTNFADRIGGAPISWGVCEAPDWGVELPAQRVLAEMAQLGIRATELGPTGYLGTSPADVSAVLQGNGLRLIGGFLPVPMHIATDADLAEAAAAMDTLAAAGSEVVVLAARSTDGSYDHKVRLTEAEWDALFGTLDRLRAMADERGLTATLHPHVGTAVEDRDSVLRLVDQSDILFCLDTGHLLIGGMQPAELIRLAGDRIAHVHLKDVSLPTAAAVATGETSYLAAVRAGLYTPLGDGDLDIAAIVGELEAAGYAGWYVLEQDAALYDAPEVGAGPLHDVRRSLDFLATLSSGQPEAVR